MYLFCANGQGAQWRVAFAWESRRRPLEWQVLNMKKQRSKSAESSYGNVQSEFSLWDTGGGGPRVVLGLGLSSRRFLRFVRSARFLRGARRGPARPYLLAFSAHHPRPSSPPSRTHVLSCARRARSPPRWRQERLFNTLRWRCAAPAVTASCAASRLAERERRSTRHGTAPNIPRLARVLPALCPQSLLLTLSPRVSCAARPHVRRPSAARERSALWWRHELLCHRLSAAKGFCQRHTPPFPDRPSNQNGKATLASPARRLPETCAHRTVAYMCPASERQQPVRFRSSISAPHTPADTPVTAHRADTPAHLISMWTCSAQRKRSQAGEKTKDAPH